MMRSQYLRAMLASVGGFLCIAVLAAACEQGGDARCGNEIELWIHAVATEPDCADCIEFSFDTPIVNASTFLIRREPDVVLARCEIAAVRSHSDAATLVLSEDGRRKISEAIEAPGGALRDVRLVALRLADASALTSVMYVEDLGQHMMLFDLSSRDKVERFIRDLEVPSSAVDRREASSRDSGVEETPAAREARALLDELAKEDAALEALEEQLRAGKGEEAIEEFLRRREDSKE